ncbi:MAG: hypothetical protein IJE68_00920 [Clostridia bacterium]|nr:hypothetical protein [Clostridia bacterium]
MTIDYYSESRQHKTVILCNADKYTHVTDSDVARTLMGMGLCEWEYYLAGLFTRAVKKACEQGNKDADITSMFSCRLVGIDLIKGPYYKEQKNVIAFLMDKLFDKVNENDEEMTLKVKKELFC